jgi:hypothetical protein
MLAIPPSSRRQGLWDQCSPTVLSWWSRLLTLISFFLPHPLCSLRTTGWTPPVLKVYVVLPVLLASCEMPAEAEASTRAEFLAIHLFTISGRGTRS